MKLFLLESVLYSLLYLSTIYSLSLNFHTTSNRTPSPFRKVDYRTIDKCKNIFWNERPGSVPKLKKTEKKKEGKKPGDRRAKPNYFKMQMMKDKYIAKVKEYNKRIEKISNDPKPGLNIKLDENDGFMPSGCKYPFAYRFHTDLNIPFYCMLKTDILNHIPKEYPQFKPTMIAAMKKLNREFHHVEKKDKSRKGEIFYIGKLHENDKYKKGQHLILNSYVRAYRNKCVLLREQELFDGAEMIFEINTHKRILEALNMDTCEKQDWKMISIVKRAQCFDVKSVEKEALVSCEGNKVKVLRITLEHTKCEKKYAREYLDFP